MGKLILLMLFSSNASVPMVSPPSGILTSSCPLCTTTAFFFITRLSFYISPCKYNILPTTALLSKQNFLSTMIISFNITNNHNHISLRSVDINIIFSTNSLISLLFSSHFINKSISPYLLYCSFL